MQTEILEVKYLNNKGQEVHCPFNTDPAIDFGKDIKALGECTATLTQKKIKYETKLLKITPDATV